MISELVEVFNKAQLASRVEIIVFPTAIHIDYTKNLVTKWIFPPLTFQINISNSQQIWIGAQNCWNEQGAFTGEIAPSQIVDSGLSWVLLGHSERRHVITHESEEIVSFKFEIDIESHFPWQLGKKLRAALDAGLKVTYAIGELLEEREV